MKFINIKVIMDRLTRHPLLQDISFETVIDYAVDFMRIVGISPTFLNKVTTIKIEDYRGELPCDFYDIMQIRGCGENKHTYRYTTDTFHLSKNKSKYSDRTYKIQGNVIYTSLKQGYLEMSYKAIPVDEEGYPLLPDDSTYIRALENFIKLQWFTVQFELGKITPQVYQNAQQQYAWSVGQAQTSLIMPSIDQMQSLSNMWNKLLPDETQDHKHGFLHEGTKETLITH